MQELATVPVIMEVSYAQLLPADTPDICAHIQQYSFSFYPTKNYIADSNTFLYFLDELCSEYNELLSLFPRLFLLLLVYTIGVLISVHYFQYKIP